MARRVAMLMSVMCAMAFGCSGSYAEPGEDPPQQHTTVDGGTDRLAIDELVLPDARVGQLFEQPVRASGSAGPYTWMLGEPVPAWLQLEDDGNGNARLVGTPEHSGTFAIELSVDGAKGARANSQLQLRVKPKRWAIYTGYADREIPAGTSGDFSAVQRTMALALDANTVTPATPVPLGDEPNGYMQWSGDGAWLASGLGRETVTIWDMGGTEPAATSWPVPFGSVSLVAPAPAGARFLLSAHDVPACATGACTAQELAAAMYRFYVLDPSEPNGSQPTELEGTGGKHAGITWSPDGSALLMVTSGAETSEALVIELDAESRAPLRPFGATAISSAQWSPDGRWIAGSIAQPESSTLLLVRRDAARAEDSAPVWRSQPEDGLQADLIPAGGWSPDGKWLVTQTFGEQQPTASEVRLIDLSSSPPEATVVAWDGSPQENHVATIHWSPDSQRFALVIGPTPTTLWSFDVASAQAGPIWQRSFPDRSDDPFMGWTAPHSLLFFDEGRLFRHTLNDGAELELIARGIGDGVNAPAHGPQLSPDGTKLLFQSIAKRSELHMLSLEPTLVDRPVAFQGDPTLVTYWNVQWISDGSGLMALTGGDDQDPANASFCYSDCRFESLFVSADGVPQQARRAEGVAFPVSDPRALPQQPTGDGPLLAAGAP